MFPQATLNLFNYVRNQKMLTSHKSLELLFLLKGSKETYSPKSPLSHKMQLNGLSLIVNYSLCNSIRLKHEVQGVHVRLQSRLRILLLVSLIYINLLANVLFPCNPIFINIWPHSQDHFVLIAFDWNIDHVTNRAYLLQCTCQFIIIYSHFEML